MSTGMLEPHKAIMIEARAVSGGNAYKTRMQFLSSLVFRLANSAIVRRRNLNCVIEAHVEWHEKKATKAEKRFSETRF